MSSSAHPYSLEPCLSTPVHHATASSAAKTRGLVVVQTCVADSCCFDIRSLRPILVPLYRRGEPHPCTHTICLVILLPDRLRHLELLASSQSLSETRKVLYTREDHFLIYTFAAEFQRLIQPTVTPASIVHTLQIVSDGNLVTSQTPFFRHIPSPSPSRPPPSLLLLT